MSFSKRMGLEPMEVPIQLDGMTEALRYRLWNLLLTYCFVVITSQGINYAEANGMAHIIEDKFFKKKISALPNRSYKYIALLDKRFADSSWNNVYDFIEFLISEGMLSGHTAINEVLESENSGYRLIDAQFVPIISEVEIESIRTALGAADKYSGVRKHIETALIHMSNKTNPDFRNSIKESISAVEAVAKIISGQEKTTLSSALSLLHSNNEIHGALVAGFKSIYGWTSDSDGIRHALMDEPNVSLTDARYMLVACSAFVNYLIEKHEAE